MPPKTKEVNIVRPAISDSSLIYVPEDVMEGFQERIETGVEWTTLEEGAQVHAQRCRLKKYEPLSFTEALDNKIKGSYINGFMNEESNIPINDHWEILLPLTLWDNDQSNKESKICFNNANCLTDNINSFIKKTIKTQDRQHIKQEFKLLKVLRVNDCQMTHLDRGLKEFKHLITLNLCGNYICDVDGRIMSPELKVLELQANAITNTDFIATLPPDLLYLGLSRNLLENGGLEGLTQLSQSITVLDVSDNDICSLEPVLDTLAHLPNLQSLALAGNPCAMCAAYARATVMKLPRLRWLDFREVLPTDRPVDFTEIHPYDFRSVYFTFNVIRVMSAPMPPKPEKGATTTFHVEIELPLLDVERRKFLMYRNNDSLVEMLPPPEDEEWNVYKAPSTALESKMVVVDPEATVESDVYDHLVPKNSREILHYTKFESNKISWSKLMNFQEPTVRIFCPDLVALRNTFRSIITVRLVYTVTMSAKAMKPDKKSMQAFKPPPLEQSLILATVRCPLKRVDWSQTSQHFHWDDTLESNDAIHWGDGDLAVLQYITAPTVKAVKPKTDVDLVALKHPVPDNFTIHLGFGIETLRN